jgi:hypothetical protein
MEPRLFSHAKHHVAWPILLLASVLVTGCGQDFGGPSMPNTGGSLSGKVYGGQQPVVGAVIQLYPVGSTGDGSGATGLIKSTVTTDASGSFSITGLYQCPTNNPLVYLVGSGGNPGLNAGTNNTAINLMAALGKCNNLSSSTTIFVNEITTVAALAALAPYTTSASAIGSGSSDSGAISAAFTLASEYANTVTGSTPGSGVPPGETVPTEQIDTLADMIAACVNSGGGIAGDGSSCGNLFTYSTPPGGTAPTDIVTALVDIFDNPTNNIENLLSLANATTPFQPTFTVPPPNWSVALTTTNPALSVSPTPISFPATQPAFGASTQTFNLTNAGSSNVTVSALSVTGANAGDFTVSSVYPATILAGEICPITVTFLPTASGTRYADIAITSSASVSPIYVPLSGTTTTSNTAQVSYTTTALTVPARSNFAGINMQLFDSGVSYRDVTMQADASTMNLGWVRFPAGTADDAYNWTTGEDPSSWVAQFSSYNTGGNTYGTLMNEEQIIGGKQGGVSLSDFTNFIGSQRTGSTSTPGSSSTHVIGVINTFTDSTSSAGSLAATAQTDGIPVDLWELGNEVSYFKTGFGFSNATTFLSNVAQYYATAVKTAAPGAQVAVWIPSSIADGWTTDTAAYTPQFWDQLYTHSYPNASTSLTNAGFTNPTVNQQIAFYSGFLMNHTNALVDNQFAPLFGNNMRIEFSEFNSNTLSGTLYNAVYLAEFTIRLSSDPYVTHAGMHMLVGPSYGTSLAIGTTNDDVSACKAAYALGQTISTSTYNFGYFFNAPGLALQIIDGVINTSNNIWPTTINNSATIPYYDDNGNPGTMPAIYAQAYSDANSTNHILLTNKSAGSQSVTILQNGIPVTQTLTVRSIGGTNAQAMNTSSAKNTITMTTSTITGTINLTGYSVVDVSWTQ